MEGGALGQDYAGEDSRETVRLHGPYEGVSSSFKYQEEVLKCVKIGNVVEKSLYFERHALLLCRH